jgi:hypothetical protein
VATRRALMRLPLRTRRAPSISPEPGRPRPIAAALGRTEPAVRTAHNRTCAPQIANHFLLPLGQMAGADITVMDMLMKNVLPVTVGNILAGAVVFAASYSFLFGALGGHKKD